MSKTLWDKKRIPLAERFWSKVEKGQPDECWKWKGCACPLGYGRFSIDNKSRLAHRTAYELANGKSVPEGLGVFHRCDNPQCCNPNHLFSGPQAENILDAQKKGRMQRVKGEAKWNAKLSDAAVREIRKLWRDGVRQKDMTRRFGVSRPVIQAVCSRRTWKHVESNYSHIKEG